MGAYYTVLQGVGATNLGTTVTHGLSITPANLVARIFIHQAALTATVPVQICTIGTNIVTIATAGINSLTTCDVEVQQIHSLIS